MTKGVGSERFSRANLVYISGVTMWAMHCNADQLCKRTELRIARTYVALTECIKIWMSTWERNNKNRASRFQNRAEDSRPSPVPIDVDFSWGRGGKIGDFAIPENVALSSGKSQRQQKGERWVGRERDHLVRVLSEKNDILLGKRSWWDAWVINLARETNIPSRSKNMCKGLIPLRPRHGHGLVFWPAGYLLYVKD